MPYAAGFLVVKPGEDVGSKPDNLIETYFSEEYIVKSEFTDRSYSMLFFSIWGKFGWLKEWGTDPGP